MTKTHKLYAAKGGGSMITEVAFAHAKLPLQIIDVDWKDLGWQSKALRGLNPLGQVPTLVLPDGTVMTESAAMFLHLADRVKEYALVPATGSKQRPAFLHWLVYLVAALYPTYTYGDVPERWVNAGKDKGAGKFLRQATDDHRKVLLKHLETQAKAPWFLGRQMSALDVYIWVLAMWRPGKEWWDADCPKLAGIAARMGKDEICRQVLARNT